MKRAIVKVEGSLIWVKGLISIVDEDLSDEELLLDIKSLGSQGIGLRATIYPNGSSKQYLEIKYSDDTPDITQDIFNKYIYPKLIIGSIIC